jgi:membrane protein
LALYTLLSLAPLLVVAVSVAGLAFGDEAARGEISQQISTVVGPRAGQSIEGLVANAKTPSSGILGSIIGIVLGLFGASGVFGELQSALNKIWEVKPKPGRGIKGMLRDRFFSFSMVMGVAFLLLVSLVVSAGIATISGYFKGMIELPFLWEAGNALLGLAITSILFALTFKLVPDAKISWHDVWVGGFVTAFLFSIGRIALAWYVGRSATVSPFGAAGSLVALIVWVYYSAQILFFGAEFAQVYASRYGSRIVPSDNAVPIDAARTDRQPAPDTAARAALGKADRTEEARTSPRDGGELSQRAATSALPAHATDADVAHASPSPRQDAIPSRQPHAAPGGLRSSLDEPRMDAVPTTALMKKVLEDAKELVRIESSLAREDLQSDLVHLKTGAIFAGVALVFAWLSLSTLIVALVLALGGSSLVALISTVILLVGAAGAAAVAYQKVPMQPLARTRERLKSDVTQLKEHR